MRLLVVTPYYKPAYVYGGPVRSVSLLCEVLARCGVSVTVLTTNANGTNELEVPIGEAVWQAGVRVHYFRRRPGLVPFYSVGLKAACMEAVPDFDLVHSSALWTYPMVAATAACQRHRKAHVVSPRGSLMSSCLRYKYWKKKIYLTVFERPRLNKASAIHCTSVAEAEELLNLRLMVPAFVVPNPIDLREFSHRAPPGRLRARLRLPERSIVTLFMGRMVLVKGLDLCVQAFAEVARVYPDSHLVLTGPEEDGTAKRLQELADRLGLLGRVHFLGTLVGEERMEALQDADLFVLTSRSESFGLAAAEALAMSVPVLLSDQVAIARDVLAARAGAVARLDPVEISRAWCLLLSNPAELKAMGRRGKELVAREYEADSVGRKMIQVYYEVIRTLKRFTGLSHSGHHHGQGVLKTGSSDAYISRTLEPPVERV